MHHSMLALLCPTFSAKIAQIVEPTSTLLDLPISPEALKYMYPPRCSILEKLTQCFFVLCNP